MYQHYVNYYETDRMGITHHSNYIRWMEEARLDFLERAGWSLLWFESKGVVSPVVKVECNYKKTTTFGDTVNIDVILEDFNGVKLKLKYVMTDIEGNTVSEGRSEHCFLNDKGYPLRMKKEYPEFYDTLMKILSNEGRIE